MSKPTKKSPLEKATLTRLKKFLEAWKARDAEEMLKHCNHTWVVGGHPNCTALFWLERQLILLNLDKYVIIGEEHRSGVAKFYYNAHVTISGTPGVITAHIMRETAAYRPNSRAGRYGVDPISAMTARFGNNG